MQPLNKLNIYQLGVNAIIMMVILMLGLLLFKSKLPPRTVKVDLVAITNHYTKLMANQTLSQNNLDIAKQISELIKNNLEPIINNYANSHHVIIIQAQALVSNNLEDVTDSILEQLDKKLNK